MELNREQIVKALEKVRYTCIDAAEFWNNRPENPNPNKEGLYIEGWYDCVRGYSVTLREMVDKTSIANDALALIKELTEDLHATRTELTRVQEENERLKARVLEESHLRHQAEEMLAQGMSVVKADTVRKMQERIKEEKFNHTAFGDLVLYADIDQIAKEMLEGNVE